MARSLFNFNSYNVTLGYPQTKKLVKFKSRMKLWLITENEQLSGLLAFMLFFCLCLTDVLWSVVKNARQLTTPFAIFIVILPLVAHADG